MSRTLTDAQLRELLEKEQDVDVEATIAAIRASEQNPEGQPGEGGNGNGNGEGDNGNGTETPPSNPGTGTTPPPPNPSEGQPANTGQPTGQPAGQPAEGELVTLSRGTWDDIQNDLAWARNKRRNEVLDEAIRTGRIAPAERSSFAAQLERDEEGTRTLLNSLAAGRVPTTELGHADPHGDTSTTVTEEAWGEFERSIGAAPPA